MPPVELAALVDRLSARDSRQQQETAKILAMMANCHLSRDEKPDGWSPLDFLPGSKNPEISLKEWVLAKERGELDRPLTDKERDEIQEFNRRFQQAMPDMGFGTKPGETFKVPIGRGV